MKTENLVWTREPEEYSIRPDRIEITTQPHTDLWQRTYYHFRNDNAPVLQMETEEKFFSFVVKTDFTESHHRFDQCGYSDWATTAIPADIRTMWYRLSRREDDYCIECSRDGETFTQMRVCHMWEGAGKIRFGIYACSPEASSFKAVFTEMKITDCMWKAHDGQQPD